jgi:hypothetical protein
MSCSMGLPKVTAAVGAEVRISAGRCPAHIFRWETSAWAISDKPAISTTAMDRIQRIGLPRCLWSVLVFRRAFAPPAEFRSPSADALVHRGGGRCCARPGDLRRPRGAGASATGSVSPVRRARDPAAESLAPGTPHRTREPHPGYRGRSAPGALAVGAVVHSSRAPLRQ